MLLFRGWCCTSVDRDKQPLGLVVTQDFPYCCLNQTSDTAVFIYTQKSYG